MTAQGLLERARAALAGAAVVVPHTDADGLAAGAIALRERGEDAAAALLLGRGRTPWDGALPPGPPALLDWGVRALAGPALIVDHHAPEARPGPGQGVLSGHGEAPETTTAAQTWSRRLAPRPVIAANDGYLPDRVSFSVRGGEGDLRRLLLRALPDVGGEFAHGHPRATGGSIAPADFERLLAALGLG